MLLLGACGSGGTAASEAPTASAPTSTAPTAPPPTTATAAAAEPTTPAPATSTSAPTTAAPAGKLIDYASGDDSGVTIATASDTGRLTGAPADFKTFIAAELAKGSTDVSCTEKPQISVDMVDTGGWARGGYFVPQCGGYAALWAKSDGSWKSVWSGQSLVDCATLTSFAFPVRVVGGQCLEGQDAVTYTG